MTETIMSSKTAAIHWADVIEYPQTGVKSKILLEDANCRYMLMLLEVIICRINVVSFGLSRQFVLPGAVLSLFCHSG